MVSQIQESGEVPSGVLPLIDPDRQPESESSTTPGAVVTIDGEDYLPLQVNDNQRKIIDRVDRVAQTVVQGPPGTGKTHTAAALVSHLLAQGCAYSSPHRRIERCTRSVPSCRAKSNRWRCPSSVNRAQTWQTFVRLSTISQGALTTSTPRSLGNRLTNTSRNSMSSVATEPKRTKGSSRSADKKSKPGPGREATRNPNWRHASSSPPCAAPRRWTR